MKPVARKFNQNSTRLLTILLLIAVIILAALTVILFLMVRDYFLPSPVSARKNDIQIPIAFTATISVPVTMTPSATDSPFRPFPSATRSPLPSPTPQTSPTWTAEPAATDTQLPPPPEQIWPPESAQIEGIVGYAQSLSLDCESRSAVDWANFFGVSIGEFEFLDLLPRSDDPNLGFVGDPNDFVQYLPPYSYGVHAAPVARLLRAYGLPAEEVYGLDVDSLKNEIAAGRPVIVWVTAGTQRGYSVDYVTSAGETVRVAPNEHTVIVIGYDPGGVTILDGAWVYWRDWYLFLDSFGILGNMAIVSRPH